MKYCIVYLDKIGAGLGHYIFYSPDDAFGVVSLKTTLEGNTYFKPFLSNKKECKIIKDSLYDSDLFTSIEKAKWRVVPFFIGKIYEFYNLIYNKCLFL